MMVDRKHFSKRREQALYLIIQDAITELRIDILRGKWDIVNGIGKEQRLINATITLGDKVCSEYRKSYAHNSNEQKGESCSSK